MSRITAVIILLAMAGAAISGLALGQHYNTQPAPCDINAVWDCGIVNHSPYAMLWGVPVALIGIVGYTLLAGLSGRLPRTTFWVAVLAVLFTLRLTYIEWRVLEIWCLYCVGSQIVILAILPLAWIEMRHRPHPAAGAASSGT